MYCSGAGSVDPARRGQGHLHYRLEEDIVRRTIITALLAALALTLTPLVAPAGTVPPDPNHHVVQVLGRRVVEYAPNGNISLGHVTASAQGETLDTNNNGLANALRGRGALLERHGVQQLRMYSIRLQVLQDGTWQDVAISDEDVTAASYLVNYTPVPGFCPPPNNTILTYRVVHSDAIRWDDGRLGTRITVSNQFQARAVVNTLC
jgi:hypothetical protein